jgi:hypothetical protein
MNLFLLSDASYCQMWRRKYCNLTVKQILLFTGETPGFLVYEKRKLFQTRLYKYNLFKYFKYSL